MTSFMTLPNNLTAVSANTVVSRPQVRGKFIFLDDEKFYIRGVTYGTFSPDDEGNQYPPLDVIERDFAQMAANGVNTVRTYTVPPAWLLDAAQRNGLYVMAGLPWEQHVAFLEDKALEQSIQERVRAGVRACADHPALLCYAIGNEIPASIVRWYGPRKVEHFLKRLYRAAKAEDPEALVTYVNFPSTEYLQLPFLDFVCFNVYLESQERLEAYLGRLQNIADERPLVLAEIGLDSLRNGEDRQAQALDWQIRTAFAAGCAGTFVFAWTDEWYRGGLEVEDWDFGLTTRQREPKPALVAVRAAYADVPATPDESWPRISVVVCSYNGARTIQDCCEGLLAVQYPAFEVIIVNDGSTDATAEIASRYGFRLISTSNRGLSSARNTGMEAATGEIIAYLDDDARPDPHWLTYLAITFMTSAHAAVGGHNIAPPSDGFVAHCVDNAPGNPVHVLLSDREAEHIPGCNMAVWKDKLQAIGGFDPQFWVAGDDVDVCWRLHERGWTIGFSHGALVWHHRRSSVRSYWRQQRGYGKAEALLEQKWPEKYNRAGHLIWSGRVYGKGLTQALGWRRGRIYQGTWGSALFQSVYEPATGFLASMALMPEWYLIISVLATLSTLGLFWKPLLIMLPLLVFAVGASLVQAGFSAAQASFADMPRSRIAQLKRRTVTAFLHLLQPMARLVGRLKHGLTFWRRRRLGSPVLPHPNIRTVWSECWHAAEKWLGTVETALKADGAAILRGGNYDRWDLEVRTGTFGAVRVLMAIEEHGEGRQLVRFRSWPSCPPAIVVVLSLTAAVAITAALDEAWIVFTLLGGVSMLLLLRIFAESATAMATLHNLLHRMKQGDQSLIRTRKQRPSIDPLPAQEREHSAAIPEHELQLVRAVGDDRAVSVPVPQPGRQQAQRRTEWDEVPHARRI